MATEAKKQGVLLVGGAGQIGGRVARILRRLQPDLPLVLGGRDLGKAAALAASLGHARAVQIDLEREDLGLAAAEAFAAVAMLVKDPSLAALRLAQDRGAAYVDISTGAFEIGPEVAQFARRPQAAPILLAGHVGAGAVTLVAQQLARAFRTVESIELAVILDEQDMGGPAAEADFERQIQAAAGAQVLVDGKWRWIGGEQARREFSDVDGGLRVGQAYAVFDTLSVATATRARSVRFDLVVGESSSRRRGEPFSIEMIVEIAGEALDGRPTRTRHEIVHPEGQAPVTAVSVAIAVERLLGLAGGPPVPPGLYLPDVLLDPAAVLDRLQAFGLRVRGGVVT